MEITNKRKKNQRVNIPFNGPKTVPKIKHQKLLNRIRILESKLEKVPDLLMQVEDLRSRLQSLNQWCLNLERDLKNGNNT